MQKHIDLLHGPVLSSLTRLAIPIMATSLIQMAYNLTDMIWIGRLGIHWGQAMPERPPDMRPELCSWPLLQASSLVLSVPYSPYH